MTQVAEQIKEIYSKLLLGISLDDFERPSYTSLINREHDYLLSFKYKSDYAFLGQICFFFRYFSPFSQ